jgi:hypothetical protein
MQAIKNRWRTIRHVVAGILACRGAGHPARWKNRTSNHPVPFAWALK